MDLFQQAVQLKQSQVEASRTRFAALSNYRQRTLFCTPAEAAIRWRRPSSSDDARAPQGAGGPVTILQDAFRLSCQRREEGVALFKEGRAADALNRFESALSLFIYLRCPSREDGGDARGSTSKNLGGFTDQELTLTTPFPRETIDGKSFVDHDGLSPSSCESDDVFASIFLSPTEANDARRRLRSHLSSTLTNVSVTTFKLGQYADSVVSAQEALSLLDTNSKAAYRLALALARTPQSAGLELDRAVTVLQIHLDQAAGGARRRVGDDEGQQDSYNENDLAACRALLDELRNEKRRVDKKAAGIMSAAIQAGALERQIPRSGPLLEAREKQEQQQHEQQRWEDLWKCPDSSVQEHLMGQVISKVQPWLESRGATGARSLLGVCPGFRELLEQFGLNSTSTQAARATVIERLHSALVKAHVDAVDKMRDDDVAAEVYLMTGGNPPSQGDHQRSRLRALRSAILS